MPRSVPRACGRNAGLADATEFYRQHREAMDAGAVVAWPERYNHDELSAIQHAMNLKLQDEAASAPSTRTSRCRRRRRRTTC